MTAWILHFYLPGYPLGYRNNMDCVWVITASHHVKLTIVSLRIEKHKGDYCAFDSLTLYDGTCNADTACATTTAVIFCDFHTMDSFYPSNCQRLPSQGLSLET